MSDRSVTHATFVLERTYDASPARVFAAFANPEAKARWFIGPDNWDKSNHQMDFRIGGHETVSGGPPGRSVHSYDACFQDIVADQRIVTTYEMQMDGARISVSVATLEFQPDGSGTRLVMTEQGAYLDGIDTAAERERGTSDLLANLGTYLQLQSARA